MSFAKQFTKGIEFRTQFDENFSLNLQDMKLLESMFVKTSGQAMDEPFFSLRQKICRLAQTYAADRSTKSFAYQCLADSHTFLQACIDQRIIDERYMTLTVGDVSYSNKRLYGASRETINLAIKHGISTRDKQQFHVWLTLADMTVVDLTINSQLTESGTKTRQEFDAQPLNVWRPERCGKFNYHPVLIDDDFLKRLQRPCH